MIASNQRKKKQMNQQPDNIRKMWEEAARINEVKDPLAALKAKVDHASKLWGAKSAPTIAGKPSAAEKKFRAARAALADAKAAAKK